MPEFERAKHFVGVTETTNEHDDTAERKVPRRRRLRLNARSLIESRSQRAIGAVVARFVHTEEVTGSNPVSPTVVTFLATTGSLRRRGCGGALHVKEGCILQDGTCANGDTGVSDGT